MRAWTNGPWIVRQLHGDCFVEGNEVVGNTVAGGYKREILGDGIYPKKIADARLVAAAPDAVAIIESYLSCAAAPHRVVLTDIDDDAKALLARIKGEQ